MLNRLYSETGAFDEISFKPGLNIIMGKYSGAQKSPDINGIGKSSVVRLIDLAFLSQSAKKEFTHPKYDFLKSHSFSLEFTIHNIHYTLKRLFHNLNKAFFARVGKEIVEYRENELKEVLADKLFRQVDSDLYFESSWFRSLMRFYIKDDIANQEREAPINFIHRAARIPYLYVLNFFLLGLPNKSILELDAYNHELREQQNVQRKLGELSNIERKVAVLEESLKKYQFSQKYKEIEKELVYITQKVNEKNTLYNKLSKELEYYQNSLSQDFTKTDIERVTKLYEEVNAHLARFVKYELQKILEFRREIAENRQKFLQQRINELQEAMKKLLIEVDELDRHRSKLLNFLDEREALDSLKNTYKSLIEQKTLYEKVVLDIQKIQQIEVSEIEAQISSLTTQVIREIQASAQTIKDIKLLFYDIISHAIFVGENTDDVKFDIK